jgi:hypothetical protein
MLMLGSDEWRWHGRHLSQLALQLSVGRFGGFGVTTGFTVYTDQKNLVKID